MYEGSLPRQSNKAGYAPVIEILDDDTDEAIDISDASIVFEIRDQLTGTTLLSATTTNAKVAVIDTGVFQASFTAAQMKNLNSGSYDVGCTISNADSEAQQLIIGTLPIIDGVVTA